jgi:hypothetical protein
MNPRVTPTQFAFQLGQCVGELPMVPSGIKGGQITYVHAGTNVPKQPLIRVDGKPSRARQIYGAAAGVTDEKLIGNLNSKFLDDDVLTLDRFMATPLRDWLHDWDEWREGRKKAGHADEFIMRFASEIEGKPVREVVVWARKAARPSLNGGRLNAEDYERLRTLGSLVEYASGRGGRSSDDDAAMRMFNAAAFSISLSLGHFDWGAINAFERAFEIITKKGRPAAAAISCGLAADLMDSVGVDGGKSVHSRAAEAWLESAKLYRNERPARLLSVRYGLEEAIKGNLAGVVADLHEEAAQLNSSAAMNDREAAAGSHLRKAMALLDDWDFNRKSWIGIAKEIDHAISKLRYAERRSADDGDKLASLKRLRKFASTLGNGDEEG